MSETENGMEGSEREVKERGISFRVSGEAYERIEVQARNHGETPNGWCRRLVLAEAARDCGMTLSDRMIFEQVAVVRHLLGRLLRESLTAEEFAGVKREVAEHAGGIARGLLAKSHAARGPARPAPPSEARVEGGDDGRSEPVH